MSDETKTPVVAPATAEFVKPDQLTMLKKRADDMGISYGPNIGVDELARRIKDKLEGKTPAVAATAPVSEAAGTVAAAVEESPEELRQRLFSDANKLVRLRISNLNPNKKDLSGEIVTVGNKFIGTIRRYVPFGEMTDEGWHVEHAIYEELKDRRFLDIRVIKKRGQPDRVSEQWVKEFALEVLEPLTVEELQTLANRQAAANGVAV